MKIVISENNRKGAETDCNKAELEKVFKDILNRFDELYRITIHVETKDEHQIRELAESAKPLDQESPAFQQLIKKIKKD